MKMSSETIIAEARSSWIEPSAGFITEAETLRWLNMAEADFVRYTKCLRMKWPFGTTAEQQEYSFPIDMRMYEILWITVEGERITPTTTDELDAYKSNWRQSAGGSTGEPEWYYITGSHDEQLGFFYCPDEVYQIVALIVEDPPAILSISSSTYPKIRETWHEALVYFVEWRGHKKNRNWEAAGQSRKDYQVMREEAKTAFASLIPERTAMLSGPEYRPSQRKLHWPRWPSGYGGIT